MRVPPFPIAPSRRVQRTGVVYTLAVPGRRERGKEGKDMAPKYVTGKMLLSWGVSPGQKFCAIGGKLYLIERVSPILLSHAERKKGGLFILRELPRTTN